MRRESRQKFLREIIASRIFYPIFGSMINIGHRSSLMATSLRDFVPNSCRGWTRTTIASLTHQYGSWQAFNCGPGPAFRVSRFAFRVRLEGRRSEEDLSQEPCSMRAEGKLPQHSTLLPLLRKPLGLVPVVRRKALHRPAHRLACMANAILTTVRHLEPQRVFW
jgi:hypothetical protein